jgi:hypothetical protein
MHKDMSAVVARMRARQGGEPASAIASVAKEAGDLVKSAGIWDSILRFGGRLFGRGAARTPVQRMLPGMEGAVARTAARMPPRPLAAGVGSPGVPPPIPGGPPRMPVPLPPTAAPSPGALKPSSLFGGPSGPPPTPGGGLMAGRKFSPLRAAAVAGGGTILGKHMYDAAQYTPDTKWWNPFTYGERPSEEQIYQNAMKEYNDRVSNYRPEAGPYGIRHSLGTGNYKTIQEEISSALQKGDTDKARALQDEMEKGNFGGKGRLFGLNPFGSEDASYFKEKALEMQGRLQGKYNTEMGKVGPRPGDDTVLANMRKRVASENMLPQEAQMLQKQIDALQQRMELTPGQETDPAAAIKARMTGSGMNWRPFMTPEATRGTAPGGWNFGPRPRGVVWGAQNPHDYRGDPWENILRGQQGQQGGVFR